MTPALALRLFTGFKPQFDLIGLRDPGLLCPALSGSAAAAVQCRFCDGRCPCGPAGQEQGEPLLRQLAHRARRLEMRHPVLLPLARQRFGAVEAAFSENGPIDDRPSPDAWPVGSLAVAAGRGGLEEIALIEAVAVLLAGGQRQPVPVFGP